MASLWAIADPVYCERLVTVFNDQDEHLVRSLEQEIGKLPGIEKLEFSPNLHSLEVGAKIASDFASRSVVPTLAFIDPWGYKGLSLELVNAFPPRLV